jgi:diaminopimelate epimerase
MIPFVKAHACGNDFLIVQESLARARAHDALARSLCRRNDGIGADGVEFFTWESKQKGRIDLYNADGSVAEISGNGTRCAAAWMAYETGAGPCDELLLETGAGSRVCRIVSREGHRFSIASSMGVPEIRQSDVALDGGARIEGAIVSTGNPHFVVFADQPDFAVSGRSWQSVGKEISSHPAFPHQTNVEFVWPMSAGEIGIRIYERGVGPTASSGTGTCAAASASIRLRGAEAVLRVSAPGGTQTVHWEDGVSEMLLTGPAELICFGETF